MSVRFTVTPTRAEDLPGLGGSGESGGAGTAPGENQSPAAGESGEERNQNSITGEHIKLLGDGHKQEHSIFFSGDYEGDDYCDRNLALFEVSLGTVPHPCRWE
ncbi:solute carrier family 12 member 6-like, partial [Mustelus asterias]